MKKMQIAFTSIILSILLLLGFGLLLQNNYNTISKAASAKAADFTELSANEELSLNNSIDSAYLSVAASINSQAMTNTSWSMGTSGGNYFYYLTGDFTSTINWNFSGNPKVFVVLNGYSLSGSFTLTVNSNQCYLYVIDKLPTVQLNSVTYNQNPDKYYTYNSSTGGYTTYSTTKPTTGTDVTDLPTFTANTYIHVRGGAISPNSRTSSASMRVVAQGNGGYIYFHKVNIVGTNNPANYNAFFESNSSGCYIYLCQCVILGNYLNKNSANILEARNSATIELRGTKIFGNKTNFTTYYLTSSNSTNLQNDSAVMVESSGSLRIYKSNVAGIWNAHGTTLYTKAIYTKDLNMTAGMTTYITLNANLENVLNTLNKMEGTLELIYGITLNYNGNSPDLTILTHGNNSATPRQGSNTVKIAAQGVVAKIDTSASSTTFSNNIEIAGKAMSIAGKSNYLVLEGGTATVQETDTVEATIENRGTLTILGTVTQLVSNVTAEDATIILQGNNTNLKTLNNEIGSLILQAGTIETLTNKANVNITDAVHITNFTNEATGTVDIAKGAVVERLTNEGTINLSGRITNLTFTTGTIHVKSSFASLPATVTVPENATFTIDEGVLFTTSTKVINNGLVEISGTMSTLEGATTTNVNGATEIVGNVLVHPTGRLTISDNQHIHTLSNSGRVDIVGVVDSLTQTAGQANITGSITSLTFNGGNITILSKDAILPIAVTIPQNASLTVAENIVVNTELINYGTLNLNGIARNFKSEAGIVNIGETASLSIPRGTRINTVNNKGRLEVAGIIETLTSNGGMISVIANAQISTFNCVAGDISIDSSTVNLPSQIIIERAAKVSVPEGSTVANSVNFKVFGTLNIAGVVTNFEGTGKIQIESSAEVIIPNGKMISSIENAGKLTIQNGAIVTNIANDGTLTVNSGAKVTYITSQGTTTIDSKANVSTINVLKGHTTVVNGAVVNRAEVNGGTLEVNEKAKVKKVTNAGGVVIDYRKSNMWLFITLIVAGILILVALAIILPLTIKRKKKKNSRNSIVSTRYEDRLEHTQYISQKKLVLSKAQQLNRRKK